MNYYDLSKWYSLIGRDGIGDCVAFTAFATVGCSEMSSTYNKSFEYRHWNYRRVHTIFLLICNRYIPLFDEMRAYCDGYKLFQGEK